MGARKRRTGVRVGVLVGFQVYDGFSPNPFVSAIFGGIQAAARTRHVDLLLACGVGRGAGPTRQIWPAWPDPGEGSDFLPVGPWNTDGLLVLNPLRSEARERYLQELRAKEFPVLYVGTGAGSPTLMVDNEGGIRQCLQHLVGHGHRAIAFVAGDEQDPGDSRLRVEAFRAGIEELDLFRDPRLIQYGQHWRGGGYEAMKRILDSGARFTAVMCSNDESAVGALDALREHRIRVPADLAVTGFDDHALAATQVPPLTTVHYPLAETGHRALSLLHDRIQRGSALPDIVRIDTWLVVRQSCGCLERGPVGSRAPDEPDSVGFDGSLAPEADQAIAAAMADAVIGMLPAADRRRLLAQGECLVNGFRRSLAATDSSAFESALAELMQTVELADEDSHAWQSAVSALRTHLPDLLQVRALCAAPAAYGRAEDLLHFARTFVSESVRREGVRHLLQKAGQNEAMGYLTSRLLSCLQERDILATLAEYLPPIGIRSCRVAFFIPSSPEDRFGESVFPPKRDDEKGVHFPTREFPPPGQYPPGELLNLAILPLCFQNEKLGYAAFDADNLEPLAMIVRQLSVAVKNARLHAEVRSLSLTDPLSGISNRRYFDLIMEKEVERSQRYRRDLSVILIDIDLFKRYNDDFGHPAGDEALKEVAHCIRRGTRRDLDVVSRYGGDEFVVILSETNVEGARLVAERIRGAVAGGTAFLRPLSISLGVASDSGPLTSAKSLLNRADQALYRVKESGGNRVEVGAKREGTD